MIGYVLATSDSLNKYTPIFSLPNHTELINLNIVFDDLLPENILQIVNIITTY